MKKFILFLYILASPLAHATFTMVQNPAFSCGASPCTITISSTAANHLGVLIVLNDNGNAADYLASVSGGGTWTVPAGCQNLGNAGSTSCGYNLSLTAGVTSLVLTFNVNTGYEVQYWEYSSGDTFLLDTTGTIVDNTGSANPWPGVALTLSGSNDVIVQGEVNFNSRAITVSSPYGNLTSFGFYATADNENTNSGSAPQWASVGGATRNITGAIAIKEGPPLPAGRRQAYVIRQ